MNSLDKPITIGFSNLSEKLTFTTTVRKSLQAAVDRYPNVRLVVRDNDMDSDIAISNARAFADIPVDIAILFHLDERANPNIANVLLRRHIPVITIDVPIAPWVTYFGANNEQAGLLVGEELGRWINKNWEGKVDKIAVMTEYRVLAEVRKRIDFALVALRDSILFSPDDVLFLDSGNLQHTAQERFAPILERWSDYHRIAVIGFNDDTALGALDAARDAGRENDLVVVGQGATLALNEFRHSNPRFIASTAYFPERYGEHLVELALRILRGDSVPRRNFMEHQCITPENVEQYTASGV